MNKVLLLLIFLLLVIYNFKLNKDFFTTQSLPNCGEKLDECDCGDNYCCLGGRVCNIKDGENPWEDTYSIIVDPENENCIDFCVDTYTYTNLDSEKYLESDLYLDQDIINNGEFKDESKQSAFFSSKCNKCIQNHYKRLESINNSLDESDNCTTTKV